MLVLKSDFIESKNKKIMQIPYYNSSHLLLNNMAIKANSENKLF